MSPAGLQLDLLDPGELGFDAEFAGLHRRELEAGAWIDHARGWVQGHSQLFQELLQSTSWRTSEERMYDRVVKVPRLFAVLPGDGPGHPLIEHMRVALSSRYREEFSRVSLALYRDGNDSVAWHGDRVARRLPDARVATVSLGAPRRFLLRPYGGGPSFAYNLGWGDLLVMGGSCQRTWQHCVPKLKHAEPRIALMFRPDWESY